MSLIETALPSEVGVPSGAILEVLAKIQKEKIDLHSFLLMRKDKLAAEIYYAPFTAETLHRMYSVTKSFTALAIGLLEEEKKINLDTPVIEYFPEYAPENVHPWLASCTIRHLLCMKSCHSKTTYGIDISSNWVESFFKTAPTKKPGSLFHYDTSSTHTLGALVEKITGKKLLDYLRYKCLDEIGFGKAAYIQTDPFGVSTAGSGMMARPIDLMLVGKLLVSKGEWNGKQLLPADYLKQATCTETVNKGICRWPEEQQGYGYYLWGLSDDGFAAYGMGGQYILCWPKHDLVVVTTADSQYTPGASQKILNIITDTILPSLGRQDDDEDNNAKKLAQLSKTAAMAPALSTESVEPFTCVYKINQPAPFSQISWDIKQDSGVVEICGKDRTWRVEFGIGKNVVGTFPENEGMCLATAGWSAPKELNLAIKLLGDKCSSIHIRTSFSDDGCMLEMINTCERCYEDFSGLWWADLVNQL